MRWAISSRIITLNEWPLIAVPSSDNMVKSVAVDSCRLHPSLYLINLTTFAKPHALHQLVTDVHRGNYDVVVVES